MDDRQHERGCEGVSASHINNVLDKSTNSGGWLPRFKFWLGLFQLFEPVLFEQHQHEDSMRGVMWSTWNMTPGTLSHLPSLHSPGTDDRACAEDVRKHRSDECWIIHFISWKSRNKYGPLATLTVSLISCLLEQYFHVSLTTLHWGLLIRQFN